MKIKALVPFSNGTISMEQYEVREVEDSLGNELISAGVAVEIGGGGSGGGPLVVHAEGGTLDKTWQEIADAVASTGAVIVLENEGVVISADVITSVYKEGEETYTVNVNGVSYDTSSASGYPTTGK